jgi:predicted 3-demethylubiquinone-9 3-methyltransferase (glyoxalase superfamily)
MTWPQARYVATHASDSAGLLFNFNESISFMVPYETQAEIDRYWEKLSAVPAAEPCGWVKDKDGLSWQIVPTAMTEMLEKGTPEDELTPI